jgi:hypothetical protein
VQIQRWFWWVIGVWLFTGLPLYLMGQAYFGEPFYDVIGFLSGISLSIRNWDAFITQLIPLTIILAPVLLLPFAIRWTRTRGSPRGQ